VKTDVTNNADTALTGEVTAIINPPAGGPLITVKQTVTVAAHTKQTVSFTPAKFGSLKIANPKLWWPYSMGDQPLYGLTTAVTQGGVVSTSSKGTFGIRSISSRLVGKSKPLP
jgi:beta-galactosidase/beta-glucuronidase